MELAAAKLTISILSPVINKLGCYVYDTYFGGDVTAEEMDNLTVTILPTIRTVIEGAELVPLQHLGPWLEKLQAAAFEAEDLIDLFEYKEIKKSQVSSLSKRINKYKTKTKEKLGFMLLKSQFKVSLEKLQKSAEEARQLLPLIESARNTTVIKLKYKRPQTIPSTSTVPTLSSRIFGREQECDKIIKFLLDESNADSNGRIERIPIIAIQGIGGSGKTCTAQGVYNDKRVEIFDLRMWVQVSRSFDAHRLAKEIIEAATKKECPHIGNPDVLETTLKESIKAKKFLLVLDDIWCEDKMQWDQLLCPLNEVKGNGSKIIITTRTKEVASILHVDQVVSLVELNIKDCWSILKHYAFGNSETTIEDSYLTNIGNQIIRKVKYSPLALRIVGSSMGKRVSINEWENILRHHDLLKDTMDVLLLSFHHLPSHLQSCFAYCSLFPKGYNFNDYETELVPLWIAQGFVENTNESDLALEEKGEKYFEELLSYSFFEFDDNHDYIMHDLLHDLAEKVSKKYCHRIEDNSLAIPIPATCIHLSICLKDWTKVAIPDMSKFKKMRSLVLPNSFYCEESFKDEKIKFQNLTKLRALHVSFHLKMEVSCDPDIAKMKHLRYLMVRYNKKPRLQLARLYHLQFLRLAGYPLVVSCDSDKNPVDLLQAKSFPQGFENLINLRILNLYSKSLVQLDFSYCHPGLNIEKLTSLQNFTLHPKEDGVNRMRLLKNLNLLRVISIKNLEYFKSGAEVAEAMLNIKKRIEELTLEWSGIDGSNYCEDVLQGLEPHPNLEMLAIKGYQGVQAPNWMKNENWLPRLVSLYLHRCGSLKELPYLPSGLQILDVEECNDLMQLPPIGKNFILLALTKCPKLRTSSIKSPLLLELKIRRCAINESQLFNDLPFFTKLQKLKLEGFSNLRTLPNLGPTLTTLCIKGFPKLASLGNIQHCTSLKDLRFENCPMLMTGINMSHVTGLQILPSSIEELVLDGSYRPFPLLLQDNLRHLSSLHFLTLIGFTTLPSLAMLSSLNSLTIEDCPDVEFLPPFSISLEQLMVYYCPKLKVNYKDGGPLHNNVSHIRCLEFL